MNQNGEEQNIDSVNIRVGGNPMGNIIDGGNQRVLKNDNGVRHLLEGTPQNFNKEILDNDIKEKIFN